MPKKKSFRLRYLFVPVTPTGSRLFHLRSINRQEAIDKLLKDAAHTPYKTWENFVKRGYTIEKIYDNFQQRYPD
jgi:hypothetical protein